MTTPEQPPAAPEPAPEAPKPFALSDLLEDTLTAPFRARSLFARLAARPAPGYALLAANHVVYFLAAMVLLAVLATISHPALFNRFLALMGPVGPFFLVFLIFVAVAVSFAVAGVLHAIVRAIGGRGDFSRSYQIVSMLSLIGVLNVLLTQAPGGWIAALLVYAYLLIVAVETLHGCSPWKARLVFGTLVAIMTALQLFMGYQYARWMQTDADVREAMSALLGPAAAANSADSTGAPAAPGEEAAPGQGSSPSGLDMIALPKLDGAAPSGPGLTAPQADALRQNSAAMIQSMMPMLTSPELTKDMDPEQAAQVRELTKMVGELQGQLQSGAAMSPKERDALMRRIQDMTLKSMTMMPKGAAPIQPPPSEEP